jgi:hypothetical protein
VPKPDPPITCTCCGLLYNPPVAVFFVEREESRVMCRPCYEHRGADERMRNRRHEEHADLFWKRYRSAVQFARDAGDELKAGREKMFAAFGSRDHAVRLLHKIGELHEPTPRGCSCGKRSDCETAKIIDHGWVQDRIRDLERREEQEERQREEEDYWYGRRARPAAPPA